jgi:hypothetical protein
MKTLNIMSLDFDYKAALRGFESAIVTRQWNGIGTMELVISGEIPNAGLIAEDDILWFDKEYDNAFIVERVEKELAGSTFIYHITANHLSVLLHDFITIPPTGYDVDTRTGTREAVVRSCVDANCINPTEAARKQYPLVLGAVIGAGAVITEQTKLEPLSDAISRILAPENLGWRVCLDVPDRRFVFEVCTGVDRSAGQSTTNRVLFGLKYGNIGGFRQVLDKAAAKTVAYVVGEGGALVEVDLSGGGRRKEVCVDAKSIGGTGELTERGQQALAQAVQTDSVECTALDRQFAYRTDYDLGDFVTVVLGPNDYRNFQIRQVKEISEQGNITVTPVFGIPERTIGTVISAMAKQLNAVR